MLERCLPASGRKWYVLRTKPQKERLVASQLRLRDVEVYFPTYRRPENGKRPTRESAFFPGYVFVHVNLDQIGSSALSWIPGLHGLVQFGQRPAVIAEYLMANLRARLAVVQRAGGRAFTGLEKGDAVCVTRGPFSGYNALFDARLPGHKRVRVLLALLCGGALGRGRCLPLELDAGDIEKRHRRRRGRRRH